MQGPVHWLAARTSPQCPRLCLGPGGAPAIEVGASNEESTACQLAGKASEGGRKAPPGVEDEHRLPFAAGRNREVSQRTLW